MQTISLHNIHYEVRRDGEELWRIAGGRRELVGSITKSVNSAWWFLEWPGFMKVGLSTEAAARMVFEALCRHRMGLAPDLT